MAAATVAALSKEAMETIAMIRCHGRPTACLATPVLVSPTQNPRHREPNETSESIPSKVLEQDYTSPPLVVRISIILLSILSPSTTDYVEVRCADSTHRWSRSRPCYVTYASDLTDFTVPQFVGVEGSGFQS